MEDSVFTKIINGEIPCHKVYEDDKTIAFLDIHPVQQGMTLVVSKRQVPNFYELPDDEYQALWNTVKQVSLKLKEVFSEKKRIGVQVEGLDVDHVHVKLFPINNAEEYRHVPDESQPPDHDTLAAMAKRLAF